MLVGTFIVINAPADLKIAGPFLALWLLSPVIARWASAAPLVEPHLDISRDDTEALRLAARQTWAFFEKFVTAEDNYLPPDNYQQTPKGEIAHRTSPTNIGLYLNVVLAARDYGWIGTLEAIERLEATLGSLTKLERFRGHFLNWHDTTSLQSLEPRYVSTVDSGNLAGNLLVVKRACAEMLVPAKSESIRAGLADTLAYVGEVQRSAREKTRGGNEITVDLEPLAAALDQYEPKRHIAPLLGALEQQLPGLMRVTEGLAAGALRFAIEALCKCVLSHIRDANFPTTGTPAQELSARLSVIAEACGGMVERMEFGFLFDEPRQLLAIGYRVDDQSRDSNAYDLLASEARLASFLAIAKGDVPTRHWFHLGRTLTPLGRTSALQSWSGSMFEYLMPSLIMHEPAGSLLATSNRAAVKRQISYARQLRIRGGFPNRSITRWIATRTFNIPALAFPTWD